MIDPIKGPLNIYIKLIKLIIISKKRYLFYIKMYVCILLQLYTIEKIKMVLRIVSYFY